MRLLITGGCGFVGSNLAAYALSQGYELVLLDSLRRYGAADNLAWLKEKGSFKFYHGDVRSSTEVDSLVSEFKPEAVFHLAGQVAMTTSVANPRLDFEINALGSFNVLEAVRKFSPNAVVFYSSTNKVYGDLEDLQYKELELRYQYAEHPNGLDEKTTLNFQSPYGCSKGTADQYFLDYHRMFGLKTAVFRHSSIYGGRQFATFDQGWVGWFCQKALEIKNGINKEPFTLSGNGKQVRDLLHARDLVALYFEALKSSEKVIGKAFNVGGSMKNSLSLLELFMFLEAELNVLMKYKKLPARLSDQKVFIADISKISTTIGWQPQVGFQEGLREIIPWTTEQLKKTL